MQLFRVSMIHNRSDDWSSLECVLFVSVVESAAGVVASAKTGVEMIEDSSKYMIISVRLKITVFNTLRMAALFY